MDAVQFRQHFINKYPDSIDYYELIYDFFLEYFSYDDLINWVEKIIEWPLNKAELNKTRLMMNNIIRLVELGDDIDKIRKGRDGLRILFYVIAIETLFKLANQKLKKKEMIMKFFKNNISDNDKDTIIKNIKRSCGDEKFHTEMSLDIEIETFATMINASRNVLVHEGQYWEKFFAFDDYPIIFQCNRNEEEKCIYDISLKYLEFKNIMVRGYINFITEYMSNEIMNEDSKV